jgi:hypothetical protein
MNEPINIREINKKSVKTSKNLPQVLLFENRQYTLEFVTDQSRQITLCVVSRCRQVDPRTNKCVKLKLKMSNLLKTNKPVYKCHTPTQRLLFH